MVGKWDLDYVSRVLRPYRDWQLAPCNLRHPKQSSRCRETTITQKGTLIPGNYTNSPPPPLPLSKLAWKCLLWKKKIPPPLPPFPSNCWGFFFFSNESLFAVSYALFDKQISSFRPFKITQISCRLPGQNRLQCWCSNCRYYNVHYKVLLRISPICPFKLARKISNALFCSLHSSLVTRKCSSENLISVSVTDARGFCSKLTFCHNNR